MTTRMLNASVALGCSWWWGGWAVWLDGWCRIMSAGVAHTQNEVKCRSRMLNVPCRNVLSVFCMGAIELTVLSIYICDYLSDCQCVCVWH